MIFNLRSISSMLSNILFCCLDGIAKTAFLCPVLGKMFPEVRAGLCPKTLQHPAGKRIPISFIGPQPYIKWEPTIGGSEFLVIKMLAQKLRFLPEFKPEQAFDVTKKNGSTYGMVWSVRIKTSLYQLLSFHIIYSL